MIILIKQKYLNLVRPQLLKVQRFPPDRNPRRGRLPHRQRGAKQTVPQTGQDAVLRAEDAPQSEVHL